MSSVFVRPVSLGALIGLSAACKHAPEAEVVDWCVDGPVVESASRTAHDPGLIYELYVRSFLDTDGDGVGDLQGVMQKLDYLESLGVSTIWLMPVFDSPSPAGYDVIDFTVINPDYGTRADLLALIDAAAARDMRVIADLPLNHSSTEHPWFQAALADPEAPDAACYLFSDTQWDELRWFPTGDGRYYYSFFGADYPDFDLTNLTVARALRDDMLGWLDAGLGGFRLDAVVQLIEEDGAIADTDGSHCLLQWLMGELKADHPDALLLSEAWHETVPGNARWLGTDAAPEADLVIDVPRRHADELAWEAHDPAPISELIVAQQSLDMTEEVTGYLSAHDTPRFATRIADPAERRAWMVAHLLLPGQPVLYYGDEIDMADSSVWSGIDAPQRQPMQWTDTRDAGFTTGIPWYSIDPEYLDGYNVQAQMASPDSMLSLVIALSALRASSEAVSRGDIDLVPTSDASILAFERSSADESVLVLLNFGDNAVEDLTVSATGSWVDLTSGGDAISGDTSLDLGEIPVAGYRVLASPALSATLIPGSE